MATLELDQQLAEELRTLATANGLTVEAYLKLLLPDPGHSRPHRLLLAELEALLSQDAFDGPSLPPDFSRVDVHDEHD